MRRRSSYLLNGGNFIRSNRPGAYVLTAGGVGIDPMTLDPSIQGGYWRSTLGTLHGVADPALEGETVATWEDQYSGGFDATNATDANRPILRTSDYNDQASLFFSDKDLTASGFSSWDNLEKQTFICVFRPALIQAQSIVRPAGSGLYIAVQTLDGMQVSDQGVIYAETDNVEVVGNTGQIFTFVWDGTLPEADRWSMFRNGVEKTVLFTAFAANPNSNNFTNGITFGYQPGGNANFEMYAVLHIKDAVDTPTREGLEAFLKNDIFGEASQKTKICFAGDSLTKNYASPESQGWVNLVAQDLGLNSLQTDGATWIGGYDFSRDGVARNTGATGEGVADLISGLNSRVNAFRDEQVINDIVNVWIGINDLSNGTKTDVTLRTDLESAVATLKSFGFVVGVCTLTPAAASIIDYPTFLTRWNAFNTALRADHAFADYFIDFEADVRLQDPNDTDIYVDGTHFTAAGNIILAEIALPVIQSVI